MTGVHEGLSKSASRGIFHFRLSAPTKFVVIFYTYGRALFEQINEMKYVVVSGGVVSGLGKGVTISSLGRILRGCGLRVTSIKIDPYLNVDAGTMSPFEHGEVSFLYVLLLF